MPTDFDEERRRRRALRRLGSEHPRCVICGETDWHCLEVHEPAGRAYDDLGVILCRNCHRKLSDPTANDRAPDHPSRMEAIGHFLVGLAELFVLLAAKLRAFGRELIDGAECCPPPYGGLPTARNGA